MTCLISPRCCTINTRTIQRAPTRWWIAVWRILWKGTHTHTRPADEIYYFCRLRNRSASLFTPMQHSTAAAGSRCRQRRQVDEGPWRAESTEGRKGCNQRAPCFAVPHALRTGGKTKHRTKVTSISMRRGFIRVLLLLLRGAIVNRTIYC